MRRDIPSAISSTVVPDRTPPLRDRRSAWHAALARSWNRCAPPLGPNRPAPLGCRRRAGSLPLSFGGPRAQAAQFRTADQASRRRSRSPHEYAISGEASTRWARLPTTDNRVLSAGDYLKRPWHSATAGSVTEPAFRLLRLAKTLVLRDAPHRTRRRSRHDVPSSSVPPGASRLLRLLTAKSATRSWTDARGPKGPGMAWETPGPAGPEAPDRRRSGRDQ